MRRMTGQEGKLKSGLSCALQEERASEQGACLPAQTGLIVAITDQYLMTLRGAAPIVALLSSVFRTKG